MSSCADGAALSSEEVNAIVSRLFNSGIQEPQLVPHLSCWPNVAAESAPSAMAARMARSLTLKHEQINLPPAVAVLDNSGQYVSATGCDSSPLIHRLSGSAFLS